ncbi:MAG: ribbon-helix-helix protein, CopG family [Deltaproteobacteria bacterium]|nr:ribbon-helix-helix protein, CopG family [Deltaproteobacteria bacterium]
MACRKTAITVPEDVLAEVDRAARRLGESRSSFIVMLLKAAVRARRDADITRRLDEVFGDPATGAVQLREAADLDDLGTDWADERW